MDAKKKAQTIARFIFTPSQSGYRKRTVSLKQCRASLYANYRTYQCARKIVEVVEGHGFCRVHADKLKRELGIFPTAEELLDDQKWWTDSRWDALRIVAERGYISAYNVLNAGVKTALINRGVLQAHNMELTLTDVGRECAAEALHDVEIKDPKVAKQEEKAANERRNEDRLIQALARLDEARMAYVVAEAKKARG